MRSAWLVAVTACGGTAPPSIANQNTPPPPRSELPKCPELEELGALLRTAWGPTAQAGVCVPFQRDGKPMWWIEGRSEHDPSSMLMHSIPTKNAIIDPQRRVTWHHVRSLDGLGYGYPGQRGAADLDGDGHDEVLYSRRFGEGGISMTEVVVVYFEPAPVQVTLSIGSSMVDQGDHVCEGTWSVVAGPGNTKRIAVDHTGECGTTKPHEVFERRGSEWKPI